MIYLLTGTDKYRIDKRINELKKVANDPNGLNYFLFDSDFDFQKIKNEINTMPFLSDKKVVVLKNLFSSSDKELQKKVLDALPGIPNACELILVEHEPLKPQHQKAITVQAKPEHFAALGPRELTSWITTKTTEFGGTIPREAAEKLAGFLDSDLYRIENEIKKMISFSPNITEAMISEMVAPDFNESIFSLIDSISAKNIDRALSLLDGFMDNEENEIYLLNMLARQVRNLLLVKDLLTSGKTDASITSLTGLHPYVVKKTISQSKNFDFDKLFRLHSAIIKADLALKTSSIDPKLALNRLIIDFSS